MATIEERLDALESRVKELAEMLRQGLVIVQQTLEADARSLEIQGKLIVATAGVLRDVEELKKSQ